MRLEDICTVFTDGDWIESKDQSDSGIRLVQTGNIGEGIYLEKEARAKYISEETFDKLKCTEVFSGDILVSRLPEPVGRACIVPEKTERMITAVDCTICRPNESLISKEYLCYFMRSNAYYTRLLGNVTGTTRKRISRKNLGNVELRVPAKDEQKAVVEQLDCLVKVIDSRTKELHLLDNLIKARFVELFGNGHDGVCNVKMLGDFCIFQQGTQVPVEEQIEEPLDGYTRFLRIIDYTQAPQPPRYVSVKGREIEADSVVIVRYGATAGFVGHGYSGILANNLFEVVPDETILSKDFLYLALKYGTFEKEVHDKAFGAAMPALSFGMMNDIGVVTPSSDAQNCFVDFVKQVDKSKVVVQKALDKTQVLFDSLMQEYFG